MRDVVFQRADVAAFVPTFPATSETFIERKVRGLVDSGVRVRVIAAHVGESTADVPTRTTARARSLGMASNATAIPSMSRAARRLFRSTPRAARAVSQAATLLGADADIIHFEFSGVGVAYLDGLSLLPDLSVVVSCRGAAEQIRPLTNPERVGALRSLFSRAAAIHCVSDDMAATVRGYGAPADRIFVNRPAVDASRFNRQLPYLRSQPPRLVSVGRLHWKKGYDVALHAVRLLRDRGVDLRYDILGGGAEHERLVFTMKALGLSDVVRLHGAQPQPFVQDALQRATLLLLPSLSEGISNSVLEAMAAEVPVVSTTAGGMGEVITDGVNGFLCPPFSSAELASTVARALDRDDLPVIGRAGRARVEAAFTLSGQIDVFRQMYASVAASGRSSRLRNELR